MGGSGVSYDVILKWPLVAYEKGDYVGGALAAGAMYWWIGGLPGQGQSAMELAQGYLLGGVVFFTKESMSSPPTAAAAMKY